MKYLLSLWLYYIPNPECSVRYLLPDFVCYDNIIPDL